MCRRLFTVASVVSLLLCLATVVLWVRSYSVSDFVIWNRNAVLSKGERRDISWEVQTYPSVIFISFENYPSSNPSDSVGVLARNGVHHAIEDALPEQGWDRDLHSGYTKWRFLRIAWFFPGPGVMPTGQWQAVRAVVLPDWGLVAVLLILPLAWIKQYLHPRWRRHHNRCRECGYNLTGNTSGVCPECGAPTTQELSTKSN